MDTLRDGWHMTGMTSEARNDLIIHLIVSCVLEFGSSCTASAYFTLTSLLFVLCSVEGIDMLL